MKNIQSNKDEDDSPESSSQNLLDKENKPNVELEQSFVLGLLKSKITHLNNYPELKDFYEKWCALDSFNRFKVPFTKNKALLEIMQAYEKLKGPDFTLLEQGNNYKRARLPILILKTLNEKQRNCDYSLMKDWFETVKTMLTSNLKHVIPLLVALDFAAAFYESENFEEVAKIFLFCIMAIWTLNPLGIAFPTSNLFVIYERFFNFFNRFAAEVWLQMQIALDIILFDIVEKGGNGEAPDIFFYGPILGIGILTMFSHGAETWKVHLENSPRSNKTLLTLLDISSHIKQILIRAAIPYQVPNLVLDYTKLFGYKIPIKTIATIKLSFAASMLILVGPLWHLLDYLYKRKKHQQPKTDNILLILTLSVLALYNIYFTAEAYKLDKIGLDIVVLYGIAYIFSALVCGTVASYQDQKSILPNLDIHQNKLLSISHAMGNQVSVNSHNSSDYGSTMMTESTKANPSRFFQCVQGLASCFKSQPPENETRLTF